MSGIPLFLDHIYQADQNPAAQEAVEAVLAKIQPGTSDGEFYFVSPESFTEEDELILNPEHQEWLRTRIADKN